ncbi:DUF3488 domain-containing protein [Alginatibacterium sediminis]|uniref:DUF3488 domain-containing protein n=1 Tax=Alginatibacterium sediminis TaxID=2164068 RepID=A0A420E6Q4_9ALTE|nr:DUF3488 and transglutaminase-like domain-containing protein [Alginatibacterium sediminis]RKF13175.1 DUF3488 domain-containing protein [Alginatibacterium sediminis]
MNGYLSASTIKIAMACYALTCLVLLTNVLWLLPVVGLLSCFWSYMAVTGKWSLPSRKILRFVTIVAAILVLYLGRDLPKFELFTCIILLGYGLKFAELKLRRDIEALSMSGILLAALSLVISSQIIDAVFALIIIVMHLLLLLSLDSKLQKLRFSTAIKPALVVIPLSITLFLLLPRLAPLWKMPSANQAQTGLSDEVQVGDISELIRSDRLAFRASFEAPQNSSQAWYWRAMVMDRFDGQRWFRSQATQLKSNPPRGAQGESYQEYSLILESNSQAWLPSLKYSQSTDVGIFYRADDNWEFESPPMNRQQKSMRWLGSSGNSDISESNLTELIDLPPQYRVELESFIQGFRAYSSASQQMSALKQWFLSQEFGYTLQPPAYSGLQGFLDFSFNQQQGFCVHYAQSLVVFARALGIPSRMVTGYLGGEWDDNGKQITIRDFDAHAWVEYWDGEHWQQVDPTAWISPQRVALNYSNNPDTAQQWQQTAGTWNRIWYSQSLNQLRQGLDQIDYWWASWVLNFDSQRQFDFYNRLRTLLGNSSLIVATASVLALGILISVLLWMQPWHWRPAPKTTRELRRQLKRVKAKGLIRKKSESLQDFSARVAKQQPNEYAQLKQAIHKYEMYRYSAQSTIDNYKDS